MLIRLLAKMHNLDEDGGISFHKVSFLKKAQLPCCERHWLRDMYKPRAAYRSAANTNVGVTLAELA